MTSAEVEQDKETRQGVMLVVALVVGIIALGVGMSFLWQIQTKEDKSKEQKVLYLPLGEHTATLGNNKMMVKFTLEYAGRSTEEALTKALPSLKYRILKRLSKLDATDLHHLSTAQGKQELAHEVLETVREALPEKAARNVQQVLYEKFLIQN